MPLAPRCKDHPGVTMVFHAATPAGPRRHKASPEEKCDISGIVHRRAGIYRCPVEGCPRVEAPGYVAPEAKLCPKCGEKSDAPSYRAKSGDHQCINCRRIAQGYWDQLRKKRKERYAETRT